MNKKKQFAITVSFLFLFELIYFVGVLVVTMLTGISVSMLFVQIIGFILSVLYTTLFDSWLRIYANNLNYRIKKVELEQEQVKRKVFDIEKVVRKNENRKK